jgi:hypothetical protein
MSTQSINTITRERYLKDAEESLIQMSDAYYYKTKFLVGEGVDRDKLNFTMQNHRYLTIEDCRITNLIQDKIEGKLEDINKKPSTKQKVSEILKLVNQHLKANECDIDEAIECCDTNVWNEVEW